MKTVILNNKEISEKLQELRSTMWENDNYYNELDLIKKEMHIQLRKYILSKFNLTPKNTNTPLNYVDTYDWKKIFTAVGERLPNEDMRGYVYIVSTNGIEFAVYESNTFGSDDYVVEKNIFTAN